MHQTQSLPQEVLGAYFSLASDCSHELEPSQTALILRSAARLEYTDLVLAQRLSESLRRNPPGRANYSQKTHIVHPQITRSSSRLICGCIICVFIQYRTLAPFVPGFLECSTVSTIPHIRSNTCFSGLLTFFLLLSVTLGTFDTTLFFSLPVCFSLSLCISIYLFFFLPLYFFKFCLFFISSTRIYPPPLLV